MDDLVTSGMADEITAILQQSTAPPIYGWRLEIQAGDQTVVPLRVLSIDLIRDYDRGYADKLLARLLIGAGTYAHDILPYRNALSGKLYRDPLQAVNAQPDPTGQTSYQDVTITLVEGDDVTKSVKSNVLQNKDAGDMTRLLEVDVQLVDPVLEQIRLVSCGGTFRNTNVQNLAKYIMTYHLQKITSDDSTAIVGVEMYDSVDSEPAASVVVPHGTPLTDVPDFLHEQVGGIYSSGLCSYLQKTLWYICPLLDVTRYDQDPRGLTIINVPKNRYPALERTYRTTARQLIVLATADAITFDDTEARQLNEGNGVRFTSADAMFESFVQVEGNKALALRAKNNNEYVTQPRVNGRNNVRTSSNAITNNQFLELSRQVRRQVSFLACVWENSDPDLIFPAMPVRYVYLEAGQLVELHGVVQGTHTFTHAATPPLMTRRHLSTTTIRLCLERASQSAST
jgi:hypothetical protein